MMNLSIRALSRVLVGLVLLGPLTVVPHASAQSVTSEETVRSVRRMLERLPYYGVFDFIVFRVDRGTVYLAGYSFEGRLKRDAETATQRASGVNEVANKIEVLPASQNDDRIRLESITYGHSSNGNAAIVRSPPMCRDHLRDNPDDRDQPFISSIA